MATPTSEWRTTGHALAALALGGLSVLAFAPVEAFWLIFPCLGGLKWLLDAAPGPRRAALIGWLYGLGAFLGGVSWVYVSLSVFGGLPPLLAAGATLLFCAALALYPALAAAAYRRWRPDTAATAALRFAALWALAEYARGTLWTGFPWLATGYSQTPPSPLAGFAPLLGSYGTGFLAALLGATLGELLGRVVRRAPPRTLATPLLCLALPLLAGTALRQASWTTPHGPPLDIALLQGNIAQELKWRPERFAESLTTYFELMQAHPATLTVLPETALPAFLDRIPPDYLDALRRLAARRGGDVLLGIAVSDGARYTNSAVQLGATQTGSEIAGRYDKAHLVPFGEYAPPGFGWFFAQLAIPMADFTPGAPKQSPLPVAGQRVALNICYEDVFGGELRAAARQATLLVNLSNTAWFGDSWAQPQHLQIARMRALESGRPLLRATNTGMTAVLTPEGTVAAALPPFTRAVLRTPVQGYDGDTPWLRFGDLPALLLIVLAALCPSLATVLARLPHRRETA